MKSLSMILAAVGCLAVAVPAMVTPADAYVVHKRVVVHHGPFGHRCRTVRKVMHGPNGKRVMVRKICR